MVKRISSEALYLACILILVVDCGVFVETGSIVYRNLLLVAAYALLALSMLKMLPKKEKRGTNGEDF